VCEPNDGLVLRRGSGRPTTSHEWIFVLAKSSEYYWDSEAIRSQLTESSKERAKYGWNGRTGDVTEVGARSGSSYKRMKEGAGMDIMCPPSGRNARTSDWFFDSLRAILDGENMLLQDEGGEPLALAVNPKGFTGSKFLCDYVGENGKPYRASPDCPIHGHLADPQRSSKGGCDEPQAHLESHIPDSTDGHVLERPCEQMPSNAPDNSDDHLSMRGDSRQQGFLWQMQESTGDCRKQCPSAHRAPIGGEGSCGHTKSKLAHHTYQGESLDSPSQSCAQIASDHSTENYKTGHVPETNPSCMPCEKMSCHIDDRQAQPENSGHDARIPESNSEDCVSSDLGPGLSEQMACRNDDKLSHPCSQYNIAKCVCQEVRLDHFATYPERLIEPLIKAGTPERGCCPKCGQPWVRVVVKTGEYTTQWGSNVNLEKQASYPPGMCNTNQSRKEKMMVGVFSTLGFRPSCACGVAETTPAIVLDPFIGSGTTAVVAKKLGRRYIGIDLNPSYCQMAEKRLERILL